MEKAYVLYDESEDKIKVYSSWDKAFDRFNEIAKDNAIESDEYDYYTLNGLKCVGFYGLFLMYIETHVVE